MILHIQDKSGDTQVTVEEDVEFATRLFQEAMESGKMAYAQVEEGNVHIFDLNKAMSLNSTRVTIIPRYVGG